MTNGMIISLIVSAAIGTPMPGDPTAKADAYIRKQLSERHVPGAQVAVIYKGKVVYSKSFGKASLQFDLPVKSSTLFTLNSATKPFTGVAVVQLAERGLITLDDPIGDHLGEVLPESWHAVTVRQLLSHVSGLPDIVDQSTGKLIDGLGEVEAWHKVKTLPSPAPPGAMYSYNQTNYLVLGLLIQKKSGLPFTEFIEKNQFQPLGMKSTQYGDARYLVKNLAQTYFVGDDKGEVFRPTSSEFPEFLWTAAGLCTSAEDLAKWLLALQNGKLFKSSESLKTLWSAGKFSNGEPAPWALGWPVSARQDHRWVGGIGGGRSAFFVYPDDDLAIIVLTNLAGSAPESWIEGIAKSWVPSIPDK